MKLGNSINVSLCRGDTDSPECHHPPYVENFYLEHDGLPSSCPVLTFAIVASERGRRNGVKVFRMKRLINVSRADITKKILTELWEENFWPLCRVGARKALEFCPMPLTDHEVKFVLRKQNPSYYAAEAQYEVRKTMRALFYDHFHFWKLTPRFKLATLVPANVLADLTDDGVADVLEKLRKHPTLLFLPEHQTELFGKIISPTATIEEAWLDLRGVRRAPLVSPPPPPLDALRA